MTSYKKLYGRYRNLVHRYPMSDSQPAREMLLACWIFFLLIIPIHQVCLEQFTTGAACRSPDTTFTFWVGFFAILCSLFGFVHLGFLFSLCIHAFVLHQLTTSLGTQVQLVNYYLLFTFYDNEWLHYQHPKTVIPWHIQWLVATLLLLWHLW